jgi:hypothetical protein
MKFASPILVFTRAEAASVEIETSEDLFKRLKEARALDNTGTVKILDDQTFFEVQAAFQEKLQNAGKAAQLVGAAVPVWGISGNFPVGDGWKLVIVSANANPAPAQAQMPGLMNGRG